MISIEQIKNQLRQKMPDGPKARRTVKTINVLYDDVAKTNLLTYASGMAYITLVSIVPSLAALFAIVSIFQPLADAEANWFDHFQGFILNNLTPAAGQQTIDYLHTFLGNLDVTRIGVTGFAFLLITIVMLLRNIEIALNDIWEVSDTRPMFKRFIYFWTTITVGALIVSLAIGAVAEFDLQNLLPFANGGPSGAAIPFLSTLTTFAATFLFFAVLYKIGPNCRVTFQAALIGAGVSTVLIRLASAGYGVYMNVSNWNQNIYGAMAAVPLFLIWLYIAWMVILFGALVSWRVQFGLKAKREGSRSSAHTPENIRKCERNLQLRALAPILCLIEISRHYAKGSGHGITGHDLVDEFDFPPAWVREAILAIEEHGFLIQSRRGADNDPDEDEILAHELFPAYPVDQLKVKDLINAFASESGKWIRQRQNGLPFDLTKLIERIVSEVQTKEKPLSIAEMVALAERDRAMTDRRHRSAS